MVGVATPCRLTVQGLNLGGGEIFRASMWGRDSMVGVATPCRLDTPGIKSFWR